MINQEIPKFFRPTELIRIAAISPELQVANVDYNTKKIIESLLLAEKQGVQLAVLPELCLTSYTCADLFYQAALLNRAKSALLELKAQSRSLAVVFVVGLPVSFRDRLFNCAAVIANGSILGLVPKQYIPNHREFYEGRWFTSGKAIRDAFIEFDGEQVRFGPQQLFSDKKTGLIFGIELCEDLWSVEPPSGEMCLSGAHLILNLSASNETIGKANYRRSLVTQQSARCNCAYAYASAGVGESTTDLVFSGHCLIAENGTLLSESTRFSRSASLAIADIDIANMAHDRRNNVSYSQGLSLHCTCTALELSAANEFTGLMRPNPPKPFVPYDANQRDVVCEEISNIQVSGLSKRLLHTGLSNVVLGVSGGVDSALALLVAHKTFESLSLDLRGIHAILMPGFGSTERTQNNAKRLTETLGVSHRIISIRESVELHLRDIDHPDGQFDVTFENAQARERTQILMDIANRCSGLVIGTGNLSEAALGWCTYNADHMSMYQVNAGVPKTLVRFLLEWYAEQIKNTDTRAVLHDILQTPVSPELLPVDVNGNQPQQTEGLIGPYELHDFFLFHVLRHGSCAEKVYWLAIDAFAGTYTKDIIRKTLETFYTRFFSQQYKRSAMPDGPKVGSVALSPRGDWRMPSDASGSEWFF